MRTLLIAATMFALSVPAFAQNPGRDNDTPGIDQGRTLGEVTKDSISKDGGRAHGKHASNPPDSTPDGSRPGRDGLANIGNDLSDTIDAIDGD